MFVDLLKLAITCIKTAEPLGLGGSASFNGQLQGSLKEPRLTGQLGGENLRYRGTTLRTLQTQLDLGSSALALRQGRLQTSSQGRVEFDMTVSLKNWSYERENPVSLRVVANRLPVADVQQAANLQYPITGFCQRMSRCGIANKPCRPRVGSAIGGSRLG
jgi:autotransporter translocation and assembly factor TamB